MNKQSITIVIPASKVEVENRDGFKRTLVRFPTHLARILVDSCFYSCSPKVTVFLPSEKDQQNKETP